MKGKFSSALSLALIVAMLLTSVALADNTVADGDGVVPYNDNNMSLGTVCAGSTTTKSAAVFINRNGNAGSTNVFKDGSSVSISVLSTSGTGLSAIMDSPDTIVLPSNWGTLSNNAKSNGVLSTVTFVAGLAGPFSGSVSYRGSGVNSSDDTINRDDTMNVTATIVDCTPSDTTAPVISYVLNPASPDGSNGWYKSNVTLTWTVTENESPSSLVKTGCDDQNITADQSETTYSCSATSDGGSAGPVTVTIKRDATAPEVSLVGGPADGGSYYFDFVPAAPTCNASDATSGLAAPCSVSGYENTVGTHTVIASASDNAGNSASASATYEVLAWTLKGFYAPVDMGIHNLVKGGATVPLKFEVFAGDTELTDTSIVSTFYQKVACEAGVGDAIETYSTGETSLRYDTLSGQFIFNWKTLKAPGTCYRVTMTTQDGSSISADFTLK